MDTCKPSDSIGGEYRDGARNRQRSQKVAPDKRTRNGRLPASAKAKQEAKADRDLYEKGQVYKEAANELARLRLNRNLTEQSGSPSERSKSRQCKLRGRPNENAAEADLGRSSKDKRELKRSKSTLTRNQRIKALDEAEAAAVHCAADRN